MSHQTGIKANEELRRHFRLCKDGRIRLLKIVIRDEELTLGREESVTGTLEQDYGRLVPRCLDDPAYILVRLDTRSEFGYDWLLLSFAPDSAPIRQKMLLAATRATLKSEFGQAHIRDEFHASSKEEALLDGYRRHVKNRATPGPMTEMEQELQSIRREERLAQEKAAAAQSLAAQTLRGIAFPIDQEAQEKLLLLRQHLLNYVQLSVDTLNEAIKLDQFDTISVDQLSHRIPKNKPRYHFFLFKHSHEGQIHHSIVFLYSMPGQGCSIKEKMLYSSCKAPFLDTVERFLGLRIDRKVELESGEAVTEGFLRDKLHPTLPISQPLFAKPRGPPGRGLPRITRPVLQ